MSYSKTFRVTDLLYRASDQTHHFYVVAADGESWRVCVDRVNDWPDIWRVGMRIELPLVLVHDGTKEDRTLMPDWSCFNGESAQRITLTDPRTSITQHWGEDMAARHLPPDAKQVTAAKRTPRKRPKYHPKAELEGSPQPPPED